MPKFLIFIIICIQSSISFAQYYDTLPKGVRLISTRFIQSEVSSSYNQSQSESPYTYQINTDIENLEDIDNEFVQDALKVFEEYPEAYSKLSLGNHKIDADAEVNVDVYAFGYGITNRVTAYIGLPIYKADVHVNYKQTKNNSNQEVAETLQKLYGDDWAQTLGNAMENFYNLDDTTIQSGIVNSLGYEELGDWSGNGVGDVELGVMYNFSRTSRYGFMATTGLVLPTGYVDDPDIIQDIGFGDGQLDAFLEFGGGIFLRDNIVFNAWTRYTYQFESEKELRVPYSNEISLSDEKDTFNEKLGNKVDVGFDTEFFITDWLKFQPGFIYKYTEKAKYESKNKKANEYLANNTDSESQSIKLLTQLSSVNLFKRDKFVLPAQINFSIQKMVRGRNTAKVDLIELDFRMFF